MRPVLIIALPLMLAACARDYDQAAVPGATVAMQISSESCEARHAAKALKTWSELESCKLAAERAFAAAIKLKKMDTFEVYASKMQALAADQDANRVTNDQARSRADAIRGAFLADCGCKPKTGIRGTAYFPGPPDMYMPGPIGGSQ